MLPWALIFFLSAAVAGLLGFGGAAGRDTELVLVLFWIFVALCIGMFALWCLMRYRLLPQFEGR
jgi:uncharacterized membrane protein YtjA (UPF0391 family)